MSRESVEFYCQWVIRAAWEARLKCKRSYTYGTVAKAAREAIAGLHRTPTALLQMARFFAEYDSGPFPRTEEGNKPVAWLKVGAGVTARTGTISDARRGASHGLTAAISILLEVPIEEMADEQLLLDLLAQTGWHMPGRQLQDTARRMARFVSSRILREPFKPWAKGGAQ
jgi:hypothetical protein